MKKALIFLILLLTIFTTEAAFAAPVTIGVIDTGITQKEDIFDSARIIDGKNYVSESDGTVDKVGHGTRVAGLIIGTLDGEIVSPSKESQIVPLVYYSEYPSGVALNGGIDAICGAIYDAIDIYGCKVINISSGVPKENEELKKAVDYAEEKGVLIVSACGNDAGTIYYPAAYNTVIGVGSHNENLEPSDFSCSGNGIDFLFSGENIKAVSIKNADDYEIVEGSSYSAALITAHAAAALEVYPELLPHQIRYFMRISCDDICGEGYDEKSGYGIFDPVLFYENLSLFDKGEISCFSDVKKDDWYYGSICYAEQNRLLSGVSDTEFAPNEPLTRAELITALYRADGQSGFDMSVAPFTDVESGSECESAVIWAQQNGIVKGVSETEFAPDENITREQAAVIIYRYAKLKNIVPEIEFTIRLDYADSEHISDYACEAVAYCTIAEIMQGCENNIFAPKASLTRAEAAAILQRLFKTEHLKS